MTLDQKASFVVLATHPPLENRNTGVPSLCIPALSLSDGPSGVAGSLPGVTQFPAPLATAATFDPLLARAVGRAVGSEARKKGIAVIQGPNLNLARVPQSGRTFETFGEDPYLTSVIGVSYINGVQSTGEMANAKHFTAYTQETARVRLDQIVSRRALNEIYNAPFKAAVQRAHVASLMCSYGLLNGTNTCSDPYLYTTLRSWGFKGFVRSDLSAVRNVAKALRAGISLVKPGSPTSIAQAVENGSLPPRYLNRAVRTVLTAMFADGLIAHQRGGTILSSVTSRAHATTALRVAETSVVLLKNSKSLLPLSKNVSSVAIIGTDAGQSPVVSGGGSSQVRAPFVITPLKAIRSALGSRVRVTYSPGGPSTLDFGKLNDVDVISGRPLRLVSPIKPIGELGKADLAIDLDPKVNNVVATATSPGNGEGWDTWGFTVRARQTGTFEISFQQNGDTWLYLNGKEIAASRGLHALNDMTTTVKLMAGQRYTFSLMWFQLNNHPTPALSMTDVTPQINAAVAAARKARVAIVFAGDYNAEAADRPNLSLPGDANALIAAVAAVNPRTIVVLNTGGAVLMPWLRHVAGVLEAWYPGQADGAAIAAILTGAVNPSGRLPLSFPKSPAAMPAARVQQFPGVNSVVNFGAGLDIGYRWYQMHAVRPLFAFGYGLSYTTFKLTHATAARSPSGIAVQVTVSNTGVRTGSDVVQAYVSMPKSAGEPPRQLRAFSRVSLAPSTSQTVAMTIPWSGFQIYRRGSLTTVPGTYGVDIGQSSSNTPLHVNVTIGRR
jgi:beta-glucosidase